MGVRTKVHYLLLGVFLLVTFIIIFKSFTVHTIALAQHNKKYNVSKFYNPEISVDYGEMYNNTLVFTIKNTGNVPLHINKFSLFTENGYRINISSQKTVLPNSSVTITLKLNPDLYIPCYNGSTILIIKSDYYMIEDIIPVYCG